MITNTEVSTALTRYIVSCRQQPKCSTRSPASVGEAVHGHEDVASPLVGWWGRGPGCPRPHTPQGTPAGAAAAAEAAVERESARSAPSEPSRSRTGGRRAARCPGDAPASGSGIGANEAL